MRHALFVAIAALAAASLACSININVPTLKTGPTETFTVNEAAPAGAKVAAVAINMGAGKLSLSGGSSSLLSGEVKYNVPEWKPTVEVSGDTVTLSQQLKDQNIGIPDKNVVNEWTLQLGSTPMNLTVNAGAYDGELDLSGVPLRSLTVHDGASNASVNFNEPNPEQMDTLAYETGASNVKLLGLANANLQTLKFTGGAGSYELDFSGTLQRDANVEVHTGVSSVKITVPAGTQAKVTVTGALNNVSTEGTWTSSGKTYETQGSGPTLTITVDSGAGSLTLVSH